MELTGGKLPARTLWSLRRPTPGALVGCRVPPCNGFRVEGLGFRVQGLGFRVWGLGSRVWGLGFSSGFRVRGLGFRVRGLGFALRFMHP